MLLLHYSNFVPFANLFTRLHIKYFVPKIYIQQMIRPRGLLLLNLFKHRAHMTRTRVVVSK